MAEHAAAPRTRAALADYIAARDTWERLMGRAADTGNWGGVQDAHNAMIRASGPLLMAVEDELPALLARLDAAEAVVRAVQAVMVPTLGEKPYAPLWAALDAWVALEKGGGEHG